MNETNMTKLILMSIAIAGIVTLASCAKDEPPTQTTSTTTETTTVQRPVATTTETQTAAPVVY